MTDVDRKVRDVEQAEELIRNLASALSARRIYSLQHPRVKKAVRAFAASLRTPSQGGPGATRLRITVTGHVPDMIEEIDEYRVVLDLPGAQPDDIDVRFENRRLKVRARGAAESDKRSYLFREFGIGDYEREFRITETVDAENISAETRDGQLILHLPKAGSALPRKISVTPTG